MGFFSDVTSGYSVFDYPFFVRLWRKTTLPRRRLDDMSFFAMRFDHFANSFWGCAIHPARSRNIVNKTTVPKSSVPKRDGPSGDAESKYSTTENKLQKKELEAAPIPEMIGFGDVIAKEAN